MTEWNDDTTESIPLDADYQPCIIRNHKHENPITDQQKCLNRALDRLLAHKSGTKLLIQRLLEICKILETNIPDIGKVENKHTSSMYRDITLFMSSKQYQEYVKDMFNTSAPTHSEYTAVYGLQQQFRESITETTVNEKPKCWETRLQQSF